MTNNVNRLFIYIGIIISKGPGPLCKTMQICSIGWGGVRDSVVFCVFIVIFVLSSQKDVNLAGYINHNLYSNL